MDDPAPHDVTNILRAVRAGEEHAKDRLFDAVYTELRQVSHRRVFDDAAAKELHTTDLVHEAYVRLAEGGSLDFENRKHFFAAAAEAMRRILIDEARKQKSQKRGGGVKNLSLDEKLDADSDVVGALAVTAADTLALDEALSQLEAREGRVAQVVKFIHFLGCTVNEAADLLDVSPRTVKSDWRFAKAWLRTQLSKGDSSISPED